MAKPHEVPDLDPTHADEVYTVSPRPEPHARRAREILLEHPEVRSLFGHDKTQTWITLVVLALQFGIAGGLAAVSAPWWAVLLVAYAVGAIANHWMGVVIHEATHNLAWSGGEVPNRIVGMIANLPVIVPSAMSFRRYHNDHHRYLGVEGLDNDLPMQIELSKLSSSWWRKAIWYANFSLFAVFARDFLRRPNRWEVASCVVQAVVTVAVIWGLGWTALFYLLASTYMAFGLHPIAAHWVHEHYLFEGDQETYSYYGPLNKLTFNMGYHVEHHDFPAVPGSKLPELHAMANAYYSRLESHDSWSKLLHRFLFDRRIGHHSRVVRAYQTYLDGRRSADPEGSLVRACRADPTLVVEDGARFAEGNV